MQVKVPKGPSKAEKSEMLQGLKDQFFAQLSSRDKVLGRFSNSASKSPCHTQTSDQTNARNKNYSSEFGNFQRSATETKTGADIEAEREAEMEAATDIRNDARSEVGTETRRTPSPFSLNGSQQYYQQNRSPFSLIGHYQQTGSTSSSQNNGQNYSPNMTISSPTYQTGGLFGNDQDSGNQPNKNGDDLPAPRNNAENNG